MIAPTLPTIEELRLWLEKLEQHECSVVLIAIEKAESCSNFCRVTWAWLSAADRKTLKGLERARQKRAACAWKARQRASEPSMSRSLRGDISRFEHDHGRNKR